MVLLAAFAASLKSLIEADDFVIGTDVANRPTAEHESLLGFFVNQLVLRIRMAGIGDFRQLLMHVRTTLLEAYDHQEYPFEQVVKDLAANRGVAIPLFNVKFALQNTPQADVRIPGVTLTPMPLPPPGAKFDLLVNLVENVSVFSGAFAWVPERVDDEFVARLISAFGRVLQRVVDQPDISLATLELDAAAVENEMLLPVPFPDSTTR